MGGLQTTSVIQFDTTEKISLYDEMIVLMAKSTKLLFWLLCPNYDASDKMKDFNAALMNYYQKIRKFIS